jgi:hypothetical protein
LFIFLQNFVLQQSVLADYGCSKKESEIFRKLWKTLPPSSLLLWRAIDTHFNSQSEKIENILLLCICYWRFYSSSSGLRFPPDNLVYRGIDKINKMERMIYACLSDKILVDLHGNKIKHFSQILSVYKLCLEKVKDPNFKDNEHYTNLKFDEGTDIDHLLKLYSNNKPYFPKDYEDDMTLLGTAFENEAHRYYVSDFAKIQVTHFIGMEILIDRSFQCRNLLGDCINTLTRSTDGAHNHQHHRLPILLQVSVIEIEIFFCFSLSVCKNINNI